MGKIMMNGVQYGVGGITDADDIKYTDSQTVKGALDEVKNGLTNVKTLNGMFGYRDRTVSNIAISSDNGYAILGNVYSDWQVPANAYIIGFYVRGWSSSPGAFSLASSSDGKTIYTYCTKAGTIGYLSIRVWYALF